MNNRKISHSLKLLHRARKQFDRLFVSCSFGKDSTVVLDLARQVDPSIPIIAIDTGYEFPETIEFGNFLAEKLDLNFSWIRPAETERLRIESLYGDRIEIGGIYKCCEMKIPAMDRHIEKGNWKAWITGLRRDETEFRSHLQEIEPGIIVKINPIVAWTKDEVWEYIKTKKLLHHPLYNRGYASLGCRPCTTIAGRQGQFERAGRAGRGTECGLHLKY